MGYFEYHMYILYQKKSITISIYLFPMGERARCVTRPSNGYERDYAYCRSPNREKIKTIRFKYTIPRTLATKSELRLCCISNIP